jgi:hypothetical protein
VWLKPRISGKTLSSKDAEESSSREAETSREQTFMAFRDGTVSDEITDDSVK